jgi:hypothetical protein
VGGRRGQEIRRRARVRTRRSMMSAEGAELTGQAHSAERERKWARGATSRRLAIRAHEIERERKRAGEKNWRRQIGPLGSERGREGAREGELPLTGGVRLSDGAGARARGLAGPTWASWAALSFSFSLNFLISFPFLFL